MTPDNNHAYKSWYLVYTKPRQEAIAMSNLVRQGYVVYLPLMRESRKRQGHRTLMEEPLFPRYLFIHLDSQTDNWGPIRSTLGVASLVRFGQEPARIPDELVDFLKAREGEKGLHIWAERHYRAGDKVRMVEGAFRGYQGILQANTGNERVIVLLDILGRQVRTKVDMGQIERE